MRPPFVTKQRPPIWKILDPPLILFDISQYRPLEGGNTNKMKVASRTGDKCFCSGMRLSLYLPPADEVLGKVIFSQASVILSTGRRAWQGGVRVGGVCVVGGCDDGHVRQRDMSGRGGPVWWGVCMVGGMHGRGHAWQGRAWWWGGACVVRGCVWQGVCMVGETATAAGCTHPTGMHSC